MNQILNVKEINNSQPIKNKGRKKKNKSAYTFTGPKSSSSDVKSISKFFAIAIIIFGIFLIGSASYALTTKSGSSQGTVVSKPIITAQMTDAGDEVTISVQSQNVINEIIYSWDDGEETRINGNGRTNIQETIPLPSGDNNLYIRAVDANGESQIIEQPFTRVSNIEITIEEMEGNKVKITVEGTNENEIKFITYRWNSDTKETIDINNIKGEEIIDAKPGENTLTVEAMDMLDETYKEEKVIKGASEAESTSQPEGDEEGSTGPKISIVPGEDTKFVIVIEDESGITKMESKINGEVQPEATIDGRTKIEIPYPFEINNGDKVEVTAYNKNGQKNTLQGQFDQN